MTWIFSALTTTTKSPVSTCGVYCGLPLPRSCPRSASRDGRGSCPRRRRRTSRAGSRPAWRCRSSSRRKTAVRRPPTAECSSLASLTTLRRSGPSGRPRTRPRRRGRVADVRSARSRARRSGRRRRTRRPAREPLEERQARADLRRVGARFDVAVPGWVGTTFQSRTSSRDPELGEDAVDDRRRRLRRARARQLALRRERACRRRAPPR